MFQAADLDLVRHGGAAFRTFVNIAALWDLTPQEQTDLLSIDASTFDDLKLRTLRRENVEVPMDVVIRLGCVLSIYASLAKLLNVDRSAKWLRAPNSAPLFHGKTALELMTTGDLADLDNVVKYLLAEIHSPGSVLPPDSVPEIVGDNYSVVFIDEIGLPRP